MADIGEVDSPVGTLKSTLRAARIVNGQGGFIEVFRKLATYDLEAYVAVAAAGLNKKPTEVEDAVFQAGLTNLVAPFSTFVEYLSNGGKPLKPAPEGAGSGEG